MHWFRLIASTAVAFLLSGCDFKGEVRSSFGELPIAGGTFSFNAEGDNPASPELEAMLRILLNNYGWVEEPSPGFEVHYSYDTKPHVPMVKLPPMPSPRIARIAEPGNPLLGLAEQQNLKPLVLPPYIKFFKKTLRIWFVDHASKKRGAESRVDQVDGCADIRVAMPYIVAMAFDQFPQGHPESVTLSVSDDSPHVSKLYMKHPEWNFSTCPKKAIESD